MYEDITTEEIISTLKRTHKSKSPGIDKILNFWLRHLHSTYPHNTKHISENIKNPEKNAWLVLSEE